MEQGRVFICDDQPEVLRLLEKMLAPHYAVHTFSGGAQLIRAVEEAREERPDLVLLDVKMPEIDGLEVLRRLKAIRPELTVVMMTAYGTVRGAVDAMRLDAYDYLLKPFSTEELNAVVEKVVERNRLLEENRSLKAEIRKRFDPDQVIYKSTAFKSVFDLAQKVAPSDASVLVMGESGTGKELIASTIHYGSRRREQRFLTINCAALTDTLLESQLFGHVKGAFTGAVATRRGLVEEAHRGTLFLDEIGDISAGMQAKLLRVLQEKEFIPVGSTKVRHADVRFVAATNKELEQEVAEGRFREDLYYRLNVVSLRIPPLRERGDDIAPLAEFFIDKYAPARTGKKFTAEAMDLMCNYHWPGNVRELENVIEMAAIFSEDGPIRSEHLPVKLAEKKKEVFALPETELTLEDVERLYIEKVYRNNRYHKTRTSQILNVSRKTLDRKLRQYGIGKDED